jgi:hypothetical protein
MELHTLQTGCALTSIAEKNAVGITEVADVTTTYDDRFYWGVDNPKAVERQRRI